MESFTHFYFTCAIRHNRTYAAEGSGSGIAVSPSSFHHKDNQMISTEHPYISGFLKMIMNSTEKKIFFISVLTLFSLFTSNIFSQGWYNSSWLYRKTITIDYTKVGATGAPHTNFPVLINITDADISSKARADGFDILFTSSDGTTKLNHERERYTSGTGNLVTWVQVPSLSSIAATDIYLYYGNSSSSDQQNAAGVWDSNFKGVWHLKESGNGTAGEFKDGTSNVNNGQGGGGTPSQVPTQTSSGKVDYANTFDGTSDYINIPYAVSLAITGDITVGAWVNLTSTASSWCYLGYHSSKYEFGFYNDAKPRFKPRNNSGTYFEVAASTAITTGSWHYIVGVLNGANVILYVDGALVTSRSDFTGSLAEGGTSKNLVFGGTSTGKWLTGTIDEFHVSSSARSTGWIVTEYNNQNSPSTFYSVGPEVLPVELTSFSASLRNGTVRLTWTTATETNNYGFEIERSIDQADWNTIAFVQGYGTSNIPHTYSYDDIDYERIKQTTKNIRYRLKQLDRDGSHEYSSIVKVTSSSNPEAFSLFVSPSPSRDKATAYLSLREAQPVTLTIYDVIGRVVKTYLSSFMLQSGSYIYPLDVNSMSNGIYYVVLQTSFGVRTQPLVVQK